MKFYSTLEVVFAESLAANPTDFTQNGRFFYDSVLGVAKMRMGGSWKTLATTDTAIVNPMTTAGDTIYGAALGVSTRLAGGATQGAWYCYDLANTKPEWTRTAVFKDAATNVATAEGWQFARKSSGTAAAGFGGRINLSIQNALGTQRDAAYIQWALTTATNAAEASELSLWTRTAGAAATKNLIVAGTGKVTFGSDTANVKHACNGGLAVGGENPVGSESPLISGSSRFDLNAGSSHTIGTGDLLGFLFITNVDDKSFAIYTLNGTAHNTTELSDIGASYNNADSTSVNRIFWDGSSYVLKNAAAGGKAYILFYVSMSSGSAQLLA